MESLIKRGYKTNEICKITGLTRKEIEVINVIVEP